MSELLSFRALAPTFCRVHCRTLPGETATVTATLIRGHPAQVGDHRVEKEWVVRSVPGGHNVLKLYTSRPQSVAGVELGGTGGLCRARPTHTNGGTDFLADFLSTTLSAASAPGTVSSRGELVLVLLQEALEARMLTDRVPARVEPQPVDAQEPWSCEELLDLVQRGIYVASLREDPRTLRSDDPTVVGVLPVDDRLL